MKLGIDLSKKEMHMEADVEPLISKGLDIHAAKPKKKTRYQIRQEEKWKNKELEFRQQKFWMFAMLLFIVLIFLIAIVATKLGL